MLYTVIGLTKDVEGESVLPPRSRHCYRGGGNMHSLPDFRRREEITDCAPSYG